MVDVYRITALEAFKRVYEGYVLRIFTRYNDVMGMADEGEVGGVF